MVVPTGKYLTNQEPTDETIIINHHLPGRCARLIKIHKTQVIYKPNSIVIKPDSVT
jgi:hypothetical protein